MRRTAVFATALTFVLTVVLVAAPTALAKDYSMTRVEIDAQIEADGSVLVTENRTFDFSGDFTFVYWELDKADSDGLEIIGMSGPEGVATHTDSPTARDDRPSGTYQVTDEGSYLDVRTFFRLSDSVETITLQYRILGGAKRWEDTSEFYWKLIGDRWDRVTYDITIDVIPPEGVANSDVRAWAHGPLTGEVDINEDASITLVLDQLPSYTFVEPRLLFPAEALPGAPIIPGTRFDEVIAEETEWAEDANRSRTQAKVVSWVFAAIGLVGPIAALAAALVMFFMWGKEHKPQFQGEYFRELPSDLSPAAVGVLMSMRDPGDDELAATIMDLVNRGVLSIQPEVVEDRGLFGTKQEQTYRLYRIRGWEHTLSKAESALVAHLFDVMGGGADSFTFHWLKDVAKRQPQTFSAASRHGDVRSRPRRRQRTTSMRAVVGNPVWLCCWVSSRCSHRVSRHLRSRRPLPLCSRPGDDHALRDCKVHETEDPRRRRVARQVRRIEKLP